MANTTWKQVVLDTADAYREANGSTEKIPVGSLADKVRAGAGTPYTGDNPLTIGQAGYTFPAKTLLKDGLQIINGVNGEDLTDTAADQTTAVEELMKMVNRKIAMNNGEGAYVWKKYSVENKVYQTTENAFLMGAAGTTRTITIAYASDYSFNEETKTFTLINPKEYEETLSSVNENVIDGSYVIQSIDSWQDTLTEGSVMLYIPEGASVTVENYKFTTSGDGQALLVENATVYKYGEVKEFLNYVVSSGAEDYPDIGMQEGYGYEAMVGGAVGIAVGEITPTSNMNKLTVEHDLGVVPTTVMAFALTSPSTGSLIEINKTVSGKTNGLYKGTGTTSAMLYLDLVNPAITLSETTIEMSGKKTGNTQYAPFERGITYKWIAAF